MKRIGIAMLIMLAIVAQNALCTGTPPGGAGEEESTFIWAAPREVITLDAQRVTDNLSGDVLYHISEGLLREFNGEISPGLAERWTVSDDGLVYTFRLRRSVWSDGVPLTANDVVYSMLRHLDPATGAATVDTMYMVSNAQGYATGELTDASQVGIKALDDYTVQITLDYPVPYFLLIIASGDFLYPVRKDYVERYGESYGSEPANLITNGPFKLETWAHEASMTLVKNENFWDADAIKLDRIERIIVPDNNTMVSMYDNGEVDIVGNIGTAFLGHYPNAITTPSGAIHMIQYNVNGISEETRPYMSNVSFRKALGLAIDVKALVDAGVLNKFAVTTGRFTYPDAMGVHDTFHNEYPIDTYPPHGDAALAKQYLQTALNEIGATIDDVPVLTYVCFDVGPRQLIAQAMVDAWEKVLGIEVEIRIFPIPQAIQNTAMRQYDIYYQSFGALSDPYDFLQYWVAGGGINWTGWNDETYTNMVMSTNGIQDAAARFKILADAEQYLMENVPLYPLVHDALQYVYRDDKFDNVVETSAGIQLIYAEPK